MFDKILIAGSSETAIRIMRTCRRLGIRTVVVCYDVDTDNLYKQLADETVQIGGPQELFSNGEKIISAALSTGCRAIHPVSGILSENAGFARKVESSGLIFIGPPSEVIATIDDKITAKELAIKAGITVIPGHADTLKDEDEALALAESIGYPVVLKPATGKGGKGICIVRKPDEMEAALAESRRETRKAFGNSRIFMERFIDKAHHVEVQIMADSSGNLLCLGERDCSIQYSYRKIVEESPSPLVSAELRQCLRQASCDLACKAAYVGIGTVEFILDAQGRFYFLEINTSFSKEHALTELLTGLDLVELQLQIACGKSLAAGNSNPVSDGCAMEAKIYTDVSEKGIIPSTCIITHYSEPQANAVRIESTVKNGSKVDVLMDSPIAGIACYGKNREAARTALVEALQNYRIEGINTNIDFLIRILCHPEFIKGCYTTGFIDHYLNT